MIRFGIITVSTTCAIHPEKDKAGPGLENEIKKSFPEGQVTFRKIVTDELFQICSLLKEAADDDLCDVLITVGGTGFSPTDVTPEATKSVVDKEAPGLVYALLSRSLGPDLAIPFCAAVTETAMLSRPVSGIRKKTIIINFPGSLKAAVECFSFIKNSLPHAVGVLRENISMVKKDHQAIQISEEESKVKISTGASRVRKSPYPMLEVDEAQKIVSDFIRTDDEVVSIDDALTRVLAETIKAPTPVPPFPASIKDGYAVRAADGAGNRVVRSAAAAGDAPDNQELRPGEIIRISTGAAVPVGADAVVQVEDTELIEVHAIGGEEKIVKICTPPKTGQDIRPIGSDIEANTVVLQKHTPISAAYIGVLAMLGITKVKVVRRPSIGVISTGNELMDPKEKLTPGCIYDSNKLTLLSLLKSFGYDADDCGIAKDKPTSVKTILSKALENHDFIISSGGVSMSEHDLLKEVLMEDFGATIRFGRLNMKPGKPTVFATLTYKNRDKLIFSLPGNPVSCCVTSLLFVIPALKKYERDSSFNGWPKVNVILVHDIVNNDPRPEYVRLKVTVDINGQLKAHSTGNQISSRLNSMVDANALFLISGKSTKQAGEIVSAFLFGKLS